MRRCKACGGPNFGLGAYCAKCCGPTALTRTPDHATSEAAAASIQRHLPTIRARVLNFAENTPEGFIDHDLLVKFGGAESSYRKRRTELTEEGLIVATNSTRTNRNGEEATVYVHRKFHPAPPPVVAKEKGKSAQAIQRNQREKQMFNALVMCAPAFIASRSERAEAVATALGIPYPIRQTDIPALRPL